jgi:MYXO-CTERM domain-containing protein
VKRALVALGAASILAGVLLSPSTARANGRFPESNQIVFSESDTDLVILRVTFGLLVSHDRGKTWRWTCERAVGIISNEDPMYAATPSGTLIGTTFNGVTLSKDEACSWSYAGGTTDGLVFIDLAQNPNDARDVIALASSYESQDEAGATFFKTQVFETKDEGASFAQLGPTFDPKLLAETLDFTKSDPNRLYVSALADSSTAPRGVLLRSSDRGLSWQSIDIPLLNPCTAEAPCTERSVYIAAVDPNDANRVYLRTRNAVDRPARVLLSRDGGQTVETIYTSKGALPGFALSADGSKVWVGGPKDGVMQASTTDFQFQQRSTVEVQCLAYASDGLWACSSEKSGFVAGLSRDEGATFEARLKFCDIAGPLACGADTPTTTQCAPLWEQQRSLLGCGVADGGAGGDGGASSSGGVGPGDGGDDGGCSCRATSSPPYAVAVGGALGLLALVRRRRRGRRGGGAA